MHNCSSCLLQEPKLQDLVLLVAFSPARLPLSEDSFVVLEAFSVNPHLLSNIGSHVYGQFLNLE